MSFKDHFSDAPAQYAAARPNYPPGLAAFLAQAAPQPDTALDCACGSGQFSVSLAAHFKRVIATDASAAQTAHAAARPNIEYRTTSAEHSGLPDTCADLVAAAQAAHWFDLPAFYREAERVACPNAVIALVSYGIPQLEDPAANRVFQTFYRSLAPYWPPERCHVENGYAGLPFPFPEIPVPPMAMAKQWTLAELLAYTATWSAAKAARKAAADPLPPFAARLAALWPLDGTQTVRWPLTVRAGRIGKAA